MVSEEQKNLLLEAATAARENAYAPYSNYCVGAAVLTKDGEIFSGANVENAAYGLTICAEQSAVTAAASAGNREIVGVAVCSANAGSPCGGCRQILSEFGGDMEVWLRDATGKVTHTNLLILLPNQFGSEHLPDR
jgi:cytidine deaminase